MDDAEVTLNVCLGKEFSGGELFFRGVRCEKHVNTETQAEVLTSKLILFLFYVRARIHTHTHTHTHIYVLSMFKRILLL